MKAQGGIHVGDDSISRNERNEYLFHHLVAMFHTLALQQLGKLVNPITGQMERDLQQAKITIDMLQMIKDRTAGNLEQSELMVLDRALLELQMNYVDEMNRPEEEQPPMEGEPAVPDEEGARDEGAAETAAEEKKPGVAAKGGAEVESEPATPGKGKKRAEAAKRKSKKKKKPD